MQILRILAKGGIISPGDLRKICQVARECGNETLSLSSRQEIVLELSVDQVPLAIEQLVKHNLPFEMGFERKANIVTSYAAMGIFPSTQWLLADTYLDVLGNFDYQPHLKVNITDPQQPLVPRFSGELNFLASAYPTFWHLYVQLPKLGGKLQAWPVLIEGDDMGRLCYEIEQIYLNQHPTNLNELVDLVNIQFPDVTTRPTEHTFTVPKLDFPSYEGFHAAGAGCWLGIFRRNHQYNTAFLEALCDQCTRHKIGKISSTPWKTLLIKDIRSEHRLHWEKLLGIHGISTHHAASELNWQLPDQDPEAIALKNSLVQTLEAREVSTVGLSFAIQTQAMPIATSVVIEPEIQGEKGSFRIRHTSDFSRSNARWRIFAQGVPKADLAEKLSSLCLQFYQLLGEAELDLETEAEEEVLHLAERVSPLHQCPHCLTQYDPQFGDLDAGVSPGVSFEELSDTYVCNICETSKSEFILMQNVEKVLT
jgi:rubredoxin